MESTSLTAMGPITAPGPSTAGYPEAGFVADDGGLAQALITYLHEEREAADRARLATLLAAYR